MARLRVLDCADTVPFHAGDVAAVLEEAEAFVIGHEDSPWTDRVLATRFGAAAVRLVAEGRLGRMVVLRGEHLTHVSLKRIAQVPRTVRLDCDLVQTARNIGISLG